MEGPDHDLPSGVELCERPPEFTRMIDIGIVGLDTSHPAKFASMLNDRPETDVTAVWDGSEVREEAYAREFCETHRAERYADPHTMIGDVDAVLILPVDWTAHRRLAVPFLDAGVPTMIDKPIAGNLDDIDSIEKAAKSGNAPLFGGSAVQYHPRITELRKTNPETVFGAGYDHPFYYGSHLVDTVRRLLDAEWTRVEQLDGPEQTVRIRFGDYSTATLRFDGPDEDGTFGFLTVGASARAALIESTPAELNQMYEPFLDAFVSTVRDERDERSRVVDAARLLVGVRAAFDEGHPIKPCSAELERTNVACGDFLAGYEPYY